MEERWNSDRTGRLRDFFERQLKEQERNAHIFHSEFDISHCKDVTPKRQDLREVCRLLSGKSEISPS